MPDRIIKQARHRILLRSGHKQWLAQQDLTQQDNGNPKLDRRHRHPVQLARTSRSETARCGWLEGEGATGKLPAAYDTPPFGRATFHGKQGEPPLGVAIWADLPTSNSNRIVSQSHPYELSSARVLPRRWRRAPGSLEFNSPWRARAANCKRAAASCRTGASEWPFLVDQIYI